jgi:hypothetical protein
MHANDRPASMWAVAAGSRVFEVVALKVTADAIGRSVQLGVIGLSRPQSRIIV